MLCGWSMCDGACVDVEHDLLPNFTGSAWVLTVTEEALVQETFHYTVVCAPEPAECPKITDLLCLQCS